MKIQKNNIFFGGEGVGRVGGGRVGGGVRVDVNEELKFLRKLKKKSGGGGSGWGCLSWGGGQEGGCERRSEVFWKIHTKKIGGWGGRGEGQAGGRVGGGSGWM